MTILSSSATRKYFERSSFLLVEDLAEANVEGLLEAQVEALLNEKYLTGSGLSHVLRCLLAA